MSEEAHEEGATGAGTGDEGTRGALRDSGPKKPPLLSRRAFIGTSVKLAVAGALVPAGLAQILPAIAPDALAATGPGPLILRDRRTRQVQPVTLDMLRGEPPVVVTAEWNFLPAVVYKVRKSVLQGSTQRRGYNTALFAVQHPTEPDNAILVYDGKCKHLGCTVGWNAGIGDDYDGSGRVDGRILCPCHQGQYDIYDLAVNIPGTPPPAPLNVVEFDIKTWRDPDLGTSHRNVVHGEIKILQDSHRDADRKAPSEALLDLAGAQFDIREAGWSDG